MGDKGLNLNSENQYNRGSLDPVTCLLQQCFRIDYRLLLGNSCIKFFVVPNEACE